VEGGGEQVAPFLSDSDVEIAWNTTKETPSIENYRQN
jgi:hypothetical protein